MEVTQVDLLTLANGCRHSPPPCEYDSYDEPNPLVADQVELLRLNHTQHPLRVTARVAESPETEGNDDHIFSEWEVIFPPLARTREDARLPLLLHLHLLNTSLTTRLHRVIRQTILSPLTRQKFPAQRPPLAPGLFPLQTRSVRRRRAKQKACCSVTRADSRTRSRPHRHRRAHRCHRYPPTRSRAIDRLPEFRQKAPRHAQTPATPYPGSNGAPNTSQRPAEAFPRPTRRHHFCPSFYDALFPGLDHGITDTLLASFITTRTDPITSAVRLVTAYDDGIVERSQGTLETDSFRPDGYVFDEAEYLRILEMSGLQQT